MKYLKLALVGMWVSIALSGCSNSSPTAADIAEREAAAMTVKMEAEQERIAAEKKLAKQQLGAIPSWALNPPVHDAEGIYAVGMGDSKKADIAIKKASLQAQFELAKAYQQELSGNERSYIQDKGDTEITEQYTQLIDSLVESVPVVGYRVVEREVKASQGKINAYVLMKLPYDSFNQVLQQRKVESNNASIKEAFDELEVRLEQRRQSISNPEAI